jgi:hypothetical protein
MPKLPTRIITISVFFSLLALYVGFRGGYIFAPEGGGQPVVIPGSPNGGPLADTIPVKSVPSPDAQTPLTDSAHLRQLTISSSKTAIGVLDTNALNLFIKKQLSKKKRRAKH